MEGSSVDYTLSQMHELRKEVHGPIKETDVQATGPTLACKNTNAHEIWIKRGEGTQAKDEGGPEILQT